MVLKILKIIDDVTIANHMESGGIPGSVHISNETYTNLTGEYTVEEGNGGDRDPFLREKNVRTYLIRPKLDDEFSTLNFNSSSYSRISSIFTVVERNNQAIFCSFNNPIL